MGISKYPSQFRGRPPAQIVIDYFEDLVELSLMTAAKGCGCG